jgi:hypothetical protein
MVTTLVGTCDVCGGSLGPIYALHSISRSSDDTADLTEVGAILSGVSLCGD